MNRRIISDQRGLTVLDYFVLLVLLITLALILAKADDLYEATFRSPCWENQKVLDQLLFDFLVENQVETYQVLVAYVVFDPIQVPNHRLVVVLNPKFMDPLQHLKKFKPGQEAVTNKLPGHLVMNLSDSPYVNRSLCSLRKGVKPVTGAIDYWWLPNQRWYCLHNKYHN